VEYASKGFNGPPGTLLPNLDSPLEQASHLFQASFAASRDLRDIRSNLHA